LQLFLKSLFITKLRHLRSSTTPYMKKLELEWYARFSHYAKSVHLWQTLHYISDRPFTFRTHFVFSQRISRMQISS